MEFNVKKKPEMQIEKGKDPAPAPTVNISTPLANGGDLLSKVRQYSGEAIKRFYGNEKGGYDVRSNP